MCFRVRVFNNEVMVRAWKHSDTEPSTWLSTWSVPVGNRVAGRVGVLSFVQNGAADFDWIGVATGGLTATKGA